MNLLSIFVRTGNNKSYVNAMLKFHDDVEKSGTLEAIKCPEKKIQALYALNGIMERLKLVKDDVADLEAILSEVLGCKKTRR